MQIKLIGCLATRNEIFAAGRFPNVEYDFLDFSWHAVPDKLHTELQRRIDDSQHYDLIILTYGRCSHAVAGLVSSEVPMLVPAVHDCISLLLGSDQRRQDLCSENAAAYYFSQGWLEYGRDPHVEYLEYLNKYGKANADYLIQTLYGKYQEAVLIRTCNEDKMKTCRQRVSAIANFFDWSVREVEGDLALLTAIASGRQTPGAIFIAPGDPIQLQEESYEY
ncbi:MAG TPA: DUF1638 domain-containing protein [Patescibacteria group bacterium]|nr:DUF1638 domain-containing protein [Patescibacteria group bacterium]